MAVARGALAAAAPPGPSRGSAPAEALGRGGGALEPSARRAAPSARAWAPARRPAAAALGVGAGAALARGRARRRRAPRAGGRGGPAVAARAAPGGAARPRPGDSVLKIFVTRQRSSLYVPWQTMQVETATGSGAFIRRRSPPAPSPSSSSSLDAGEHERVRTAEPPYWHCKKVEEALPHARGDLILTAAHVVADARDIRVQLFRSESNGSSGRYVARVVAVAHDCDLALLEVENPACLDGREPLSIVGPAELPKVQSTVQVMGYPLGGEYLSITEGVLSRVEVVENSHSRRSCLALTVDAAINAGSSGGPVVDPETGRLLAVAHQKVSVAGVENTGYGVPPCLIWRFLWGYGAGCPSALPSLGVYLQNLESEAHREYLGLRAGESGVLIVELNRSPGQPPGELQAGDVLMQVGIYPVDNFGTVQVLGQRVALSAAQDLLFVGDVVPVTVRRGDEVLQLEAVLQPARHLVPRCLYGEANSIESTCLIFGGLVFVPVTADFLEQAWPRAEDRPAHLMDLYWRGSVSPEASQAVTLLSILADDVNAGHGSGFVGCPVVERVNGESVMDMEDLSFHLNRALREDEFVEIQFRMSIGPYIAVLKCADIPEANMRIQDLYKLPYLANPPHLAVELEPATELMD